MNPASRAESVDEASLVARCREGDRAAFGDFVRAFQDRVFGVCLRISGDRNDAADATQETFVRALESIARFDERAAVFTWLYRIAVNLAIDQRRRRGRGGVVPLDGRRGRDNSAGSLGDRLAADGPGPDERLHATEREAAVAKAIVELDEEQRVVVVLRDIDGLDYAQIAEVLQLPVGTVKSRLFRGRMMLKEKLRAMVEAERA